MKQKIVYIGLDVDDTQYHGSALDKESGELLSFRCRPTLKGLLGQLAKIRKHFPGHTLKLAYEASYIVFTLQRDLAEQGICCDVVAPSSIPRQGGKAVKTDRIDAAQLAQFYASAFPTHDNWCHGSAWIFANTRPEGNTTGSVSPSTEIAICVRRSLRRISGATERPG